MTCYEFAADKISGPISISGNTLLFTIPKLCIVDVGATGCAVVTCNLLNMKIVLIKTLEIPEPSFFWYNIYFLN